MAVRGLTPPARMEGVEIMARYEDAWQRKQPWITHLQECYQYAIPHRDTFYDHTPGQKKTYKVYDSTAVLGVPTFATRLQSRLVPPWRNWSQLSVGPDVPPRIRESSQISSQLAEATDVFFSHIHHSNHATQVHEAFQDLAVGTGAYDVRSGPLGGKALVFQAIPLTELVLEEGPESTILTTFRNLSVPARTLQAQWPGISLPPELERMRREAPDTKVQLIEAVIFDPKTERWEGALVWQEKKGVLWRAEWDSNPRIVFRWSVTPGEIYGRGPIMQVLPDIKTANKVTEFILRNAAFNVAGMFTALNDGAINPMNFRSVPGGVIPVQSNDSRNPSIRPLDRVGDIGFGFDVLARLQDNIKRALLQDLRDPTGPVRSATEIAIEDRELVSNMGSTFGRLQTEVVEATVSSGLDILARKGLMPKIRLDGRTVTLKHQSPLARAQDIDDLVTLQQTMATVPMELLALDIKVENLGEWVAKKTGLDPRLERSAAEKEQVKAQAQQLVAQMAAAAQSKVPA